MPKAQRLLFIFSSIFYNNMLYFFQKSLAKVKKVWYNVIQNAMKKFADSSLDFYRECLVAESGT